MAKQSFVSFEKLPKAVAFDVTQAHIDRARELRKSRKNNPVECCPVALAFREALGRGNRVSTVAGDLYVHLSDEQAGRYATGDGEIWKFQRLLRAGKPVEPQSFSVRRT